jgi:glycosyltransferase involved in cell wall biosynthesis/GT2 family glycosyltransferase/tetratricopeptide (TPR) repeat protein
VALPGVGDKVAPLTRISLNVVVFNEEARLEECLLDARDFVDEIVVVDQMSTDRTPEIAQRLADVYIRDVHHGHAEPSRELAASRSTGQWILILDADEKMSDLLKAELRDLVEGDADGFWIRKVNLVDGAETSTVLHHRLVRSSRVRFDPRPHGGATAVSDNVATFDRIGIVHEKTAAEQIFDDARYERLALEDDAPTSAKRNWLSHNHTLRQHREHRRRSDLEALVPSGASTVLVWGDIHVEPFGCGITRLGEGGIDDLIGAVKGATVDGETPFDVAIVALSEGDPLAAVRSLAPCIRTGGTIIGTASPARNRRHMEEYIKGVLSDGSSTAPPTGPGSTRLGLHEGLAAAGFDVRWMTLVRDGWLNPVGLRPDGSGITVESDDFFLKNVSAEVAEELTAEEIVFAAVKAAETHVPDVTVVAVDCDGGDPVQFERALTATVPRHTYELVVVSPNPAEHGPSEATWVRVPQGTLLGARWNAGARMARGELLVFLTADAVPQSGWLDALVTAHQSRPDSGATGSKVTAPDGTVEHAGLVLGPDRIPYRLYQGEDSGAARVNRPRIMPAVAGEGMATGRAKFVELGGFDETFGEDLADADYCMRLRSRGLPILYAAGAELRVPIRTLSGTRSGFGKSVRQFVARWKPNTFRSDELVCLADDCDVSTEWNRSWRLPRPTVRGQGDLPGIAWTSHFLERGGYTEEALAAVEALDDAGFHVVANPVAWDRKTIPLPMHKAERLTSLMERDLPDEFVHVAHIGANRFKRHPSALRNIGRTMFETDGLPEDWRDRCNVMDEIWVPSEHNLRSFANAGVAVSKLHKVPETFDVDLFDPGVTPLDIEGVRGFVFLSMFAWIDRKAWDVLLGAWFEEFSRQDDVTLLMKTDTDLAPTGTNAQNEVDSFIRTQLKHNPRKGPRVIVLDQPLESTDVPRLYRAADAFVLPSHGEGWGRPYMEAMAMGLPTIATRWSGNLEFMNDDNSYLIGYKLVAAPQNTWLRGQQWAEPSLSDLRRALRRVYEHRSEAAATGARARKEVLVSCRPDLVVEAVWDRIQAIDRHPVHVPVDTPTPVHQSVEAPRRGRVRKSGRHLSACVVVQDGCAPSVPQCVSSLSEVADSVTVVEAETDADMASIRNEALDLATGGWVLMLDATCTLDPASVQLVRRLVNRKDFVGYAARQLHQYGFDGGFSALELRAAVLFPRHPDLRYVGRVAEQLLPRKDGLDFRIARSRLVIHQHDNWSGRYDPAAQARRNLPFLELSVREEPNEPFHLYNLGNALRYLGIHEEAETVLRTAVALAPPHAPWGAPAYVSLSRVVAAQDRAVEAVKLCKAAARRAPEWAQGWCALGGAQVEAGKFKAALRAYGRALSCTGDNWLDPGSDYDDTAWLVRAGMGKIHLALKQYGEAAECFGSALIVNPVNSELHLWLARAYEALGQSADARRHLDEATTGSRTGPEAYVAFGDFFTKKAEEALLRGLAQNAESSILLERIERLRAAQAIA